MAHAKVGPNNIFPGPSRPFSTVGDEKLKRRCYPHFFDSHHGCNNLRNTPSIAAIKASARSSRGDQTAKIGGEKIHSCVIIYVRCFCCCCFFFQERDGFVIDICGNQWWWSNDVTLMRLSPKYEKCKVLSIFDSQKIGKYLNSLRQSVPALT